MILHANLGRINVSNLSKGMYILKVQGEGFKTQVKFC